MQASKDKEIPCVWLSCCNQNLQNNIQIIIIVAHVVMYAAHFCFTHLERNEKNLSVRIKYWMKTQGFWLSLPYYISLLEKFFNFSFFS